MNSMEVTVKYITGQKFLVSAKAHEIIVDQPKEKGGADEGMNPLELFLSALAACVSGYAKSYLKNVGLDAKKLKVRVSGELTEEVPRRFKDIKVEIEAGDLGSRKEAFLNFVKNCPVHNTLAGRPELEFIVK